MAWYLLRGKDVSGFWDSFGQTEVDELDEAHQSYMDLIADRLLARGPLLTSNHDGHEGSIHVVEADSFAAARQLAFGEPYFAAGLFETLEIVAFEPSMQGSMWERVGDQAAGFSWMATWRSSAVLTRNVLSDVPDAVVCAGWMLDGVTGALLGAIALFDAAPSDVEDFVHGLSRVFNLDQCEVSVVPWRRGGRPS
jgi:uncharacterized protein